VSLKAINYFKELTVVWFSLISLYVNVRYHFVKLCAPYGFFKLQ